MNVQEIQFPTDEALAARAHAWCEAKITEFAARSLFVPAGNTPRPLYALWERERPAYLENLTLVQMDEVLGEGTPGRFRRFFETELPSYAGRILAPGDFQGDVDLAILGLGRNGHVAFHEPGVPSSFEFGEVALTGSTCRQLGLKPPQRGITYGLGTFLRCRSILLIVAGSGKDDAWRGFQQGSSAVPAAQLRGHPDFTVLVQNSLA